MPRLFAALLLLTSACSRGPADPAEWLAALYGELKILAAAEVGAAALAGDAGGPDLVPALRERLRDRMLFPPGETIDDRRYARYWRSLQHGLIAALSRGLAGDGVEFELTESDFEAGRAVVTVSWSGAPGWSRLRQVPISMRLVDSGWMVEAALLPPLRGF